MRAKRTILSESRLRQLLEPVIPELGATNRARLEAILPLLVEGKARLSECFKAAFPGRSVADAQAQFRVFRQAVNDAAKAAKAEVHFCADNRKRLAPEAREAWFEGEPDVTKELGEFACASAADLHRLEEQGTIVNQSGVPVSGASMAADRRTVHFFVSCAHADGRDVDALLALLQEQFGPSLRYRYEVWGDWKILLGTGWREAIFSAIKTCDFGLLLVSPSFFGSSFIQNEELPHLLAAGKPIIPVGVRKVDFNRQNLRGLERAQVFFLPQNGRGEPRCFSACTTEKLQRAFAEELFQKIEERLDSHFAPSPAPPTGPKAAPRRAAARKDYDALLDELARQASADPAVRHFVKTRGKTYGLRELERLDTSALKSREIGVDVLNYLERWACGPDEPPFCAVLGEYGVGKTTTLRRLTRRLCERHATDASSPMPIFVDLRSVRISRAAAEAPELHDILAAALVQNWHQTGAPTLTPIEIIKAVQSRGAVIIFDGLDEQIVHLTTPRAQAFIRQLWRALPPMGAEAAAKAMKAGTAAARRGKLVISCRSHYFQNVWSQNAMLTGEDREPVRAKDYRALILLPFNEEQIHEYLVGILGSAEQAEAALRLFGSVHNLAELASRPYLLSVMTEHLEELERCRAAGRQVRGVTLYEILIHRWLSRDDGKHQFTTADKLEMMEDLAADLFADGAREWPWPAVERWLGAMLSRRPEIAVRYAAKEADVLNEDFRTATFVLRPDDSREHFRFAHSSLQEYFHARRLVRGLHDGHLAAWAIPLPSLETLDFVGQLLAVEAERRPSAGRKGDSPTDRHLKALETLLERGEALGARLALRYWLLAMERGYPAPEPERPRLAGLDLEGWRLQGVSSDRPLVLRGADLAGSCLDHARLRDVDLAEASLVGASCALAEMENVNLRAADLDQADFTGAMLRGCEAGGLRGGGARWHDAEWTHSDLRRAVLGNGFEHEGALALCLTDEGAVGGLAALPAAPEIVLRDAHRGPVTCCAWSPDGRRLLSGSEDNTLRVWDAESGRCLRTLEGHSYAVSACAWSPDGRRLLSGSEDNTLRVWDTEGRRCLRTLEGHKDWVSACAWSPDGRRLLSGSEDNTLRVWDAESGRALRTLEGHSSAVSACAWSPDGRQLLSGSHDNILRVWDAESGRSLRTLEGHSDWVRACVWSPDGRQILSGSDDHILRVWDAESGRSLRTLEGHSNAVSACAWSPDGRRLLSGSHNNTLRVWDAESGRSLRTLEGHSGAVSACAWSPDGRRLLSGSHDHALRVWDAESGRCLRTLEGHSDPVCACAWSPDGRRLLSGSDDNTLRVWDAESGRCLQTLERHSGTVSACAWSPDGRRLLSGSYDHTLRVWGAKGGRALRTLEGHSSVVLACAWSPDGRRLLSGSLDHAVRVWDAESGRCLRTLEGHSGAVWACAWSPDGRRLLSASSDHTLRVWDAKSGRSLRTLEGHKDWISACTWSPDGRRLLSGSLDHALRVWDAESGRCLLTATAFEAGEAAALDLEHNRILWASAGAWRHLGWRARDPQTGRLRILPAEFLGPLPTGRPEAAEDSGSKVD